MQEPDNYRQKLDTNEQLNRSGDNSNRSKKNHEDNDCDGDHHHDNQNASFPIILYFYIVACSWYSRGQNRHFLFDQEVTNFLIFSKQNIKST